MVHPTAIVSPIGDLLEGLDIIVLKMTLEQPILKNITEEQQYGKRYTGNNWGCGTGFNSVFLQRLVLASAVGIADLDNTRQQI